MLRNYGKIEWIEDLSMDYNISFIHLSFNNHISVKLEIRFLII